MTTLDHEPVRQLLQKIGGYTHVARMLGVKAPPMYRWTRIPAHHCPMIERETGGVWSVETLRPDVAWARVPDAAWPHQLGRPCLDTGAERPGAAWSRL